MDIEGYLRKQNSEKTEIIKSLEKENYEVKQSIYNELIKVRDIGHSNNIHKNIDMLDIVEDLIEDLYHDIQKELDEQLDKEYKKELVDLPKSN